MITDKSQNLNDDNGIIFPRFSHKKTREFIRTFKAAIWWIVKDGIYRFRRTIGYLLLADILALVSELAAFSLLYMYAKALESNKIILLFGYTCQVRSSEVALVVIAFSSFFLLFFTAIISYRVRAKTIDLTRQYEKFIALRLPIILSKLPHPLCSYANNMLIRKDFESSINKGVKSSTRVFYIIFNAFVPLGRLLVAVAIMFLINVTYSLLVLGIVFITLLFLLKVSIDASEQYPLNQNQDNYCSREYRNILKELIKVPHPIDQDVYNLEVATNAAHRMNFMEAILGYFVTRERAALIINLFASAVVLTIVLVIGHGVISASLSLSTFLAYIVALRYFLSNMMNMGSVMISLSKFSPYVEQIGEFVRETNNAADVIFNHEPPKLYLDAPAFAGDENSIILTGGSQVHVIHPGPVDRSFAALIQSHTRSLTETIPTVWFISNHDNDSLRSKLGCGLPEGISDQKIRQKLAKLLPELDDEILVTIEKVQDGVLNPGMRNSISTISQLVAGDQASRSIIIMTDKDLHTIQSFLSEEVENLLSNKISLIVHKKVPSLQKWPGNRTVFISDSEKLVGWCTLDWLLQNKEVLQQQHPKHKQDIEPGDETDDD
ncbi:hypothetical protein ACFL27_22050 [candidate division CSSED10-310 bacterium]|uniref:ABC transmembrane type-1 domain-containing protein n=1 Tax=candidate division CSSED10-310 bacterium TaxID=2855610 RepID=A0ABV6Z372_UNCC1